MDTNPNWGALDFLTNKPEPAQETVAEEAKVSSRSPSATGNKEDRLLRCKGLRPDVKGFSAALRHDCWLSKSKADGVIAIEDMDTAYIVNCIKMIDQGRHGSIKRGTPLAGDWVQRLTRELKRRDL